MQESKKITSTPIIFPTLSQKQFKSDTELAKSAYKTDYLAGH